MDAIKGGSLDGSVQPAPDAVSSVGRETGRGPSTEDERPFGWGLCRECGCDAEEADYDPWTRTTLCAKCIALQDDRRNSTPDDYSGEAA
jgi:hypothetical protein